MKTIMEKINPNVLVATLGIITVAIFASITVLTLNGVSADQITVLLTSAIGSITALIAAIGAVKVHGVRQDTQKMLNGTMDAKIVNGVKAALIDLGIVHTTAAPLTAETAATHVVESLANKPTPDGGTQVP